MCFVNDFFFAAPIEINFKLTVFLSVVSYDSLSFIRVSWILFGFFCRNSGEQTNEQTKKQTEEQCIDLQCRRMMDEVDFSHVFYNIAH